MVLSISSSGLKAPSPEVFNVPIPVTSYPKEMNRLGLKSKIFGLQ